MPAVTLDGMARTDTSPPDEVIAGAPLGLRLTPLLLLGFSVLLGRLLTPDLLPADQMRMSLLPSAALLVLRIASEAASGRVRVGGAVSLVGWGAHALVLLAGTLANPFLCIYAFFGYVDAERFLGRRLVVPAIVVVGVTCGLGQSGGVHGITSLPVLFVALAMINIVLALLMSRLTESHEREVAAREEAVEALAEAHRENLALHDQLLQQAREAGIVDERARLSRELHDTVAQGLVGVIRQLENLPAGLDPPVKARIDRAEEAARDCLTEARRAVRALTPYQLQDADLIDAVRSVVRNWSRIHDIPAQVRVDGTPAPGPGDDVVLRVVQESLANVARHARARSVTVTLSWLGEELIVDVRDDGAGFDPASAVRGRGLDSMTERLEAAGGRLVIESAPEEGTTVAAVVPR